MFKRFFYIFIILLLFTAIAKSSGLSYKNYDKVLMYVYTPECGYCVNFNPVYEKISKKYNNTCKFYKVDANTKEGYELLRNFHVFAVPFVAIIDNKKNEAKQISPNCLLSFACTDKILNEFTKK